MKKHVYKIIIIGAGISGLSAGKTLLENGIDDFIILEAKGKTGGRIESFELGNSLIELGAQWIHGQENEFFSFIQKHNQIHPKTSWEGKGDFLMPNGEKGDPKMIQEILTWTEDMLEEIENNFSIEDAKVNAGEAKKDNKKSVGTYLIDKFFDWMKTKGNRDLDLSMAIFQWAMSFQRIDNCCNNMSELSIYRWGEFEINPGENYNNFLKGAQNFVQNFMEGPLRNKIKLNSPVERIQTDGENPKIFIKHNESPFESQIVLYSVSMGVLKANKNSFFEPNLPKCINEVIDKSGFGPLTKIFLEFDKPWWIKADPVMSSFQGFQLIWPNEFIDCISVDEIEPLEKRWPKSITGFDPVLNNPNVLLAWMGGEEAVFVENLDKNEIGKVCVEILSKFTKISVPLPINVKISKWNTDPYFKGAYCYRSTESDSIKGDICQILSQPILSHNQNPVLYFCGEALSYSHYSTLHGAFESGHSQALKIVEYLKNNNLILSNGNVNVNGQCIKSNGVINHSNDVNYVVTP